MRFGSVDVLVPTYGRPAALAVALAGLAGQTFGRFRVVVADQTDPEPAFARPEVEAVARVLRMRGREVELRRNLPRRGLAQQRDFLLARARSPAAFFLDDDIWLEPDVLERLVRVLRDERCGFVGMGLIGASFGGDRRPDEEAIEFWDGPVAPEVVRPGTSAWERYRLHNAANLLHVQSRLGFRERRYKVAWVGGCVLYDSAKLRSAGGFGFWRSLPDEHAGEDVAAQLRVMALFGGCGVLPSGAYHLELPTTIRNRDANAVTLASAEAGEPGSGRVRGVASRR